MGENGRDRESRWARLKTFMAVLAAAFAVTLGVTVGNRLSEEALGVLAGAVCGVGAAIPTSLIVVAVSRRQADSSSSGATRMRAREVDYEPRRAYPPVVVVSPGSAPQRPHSSWNALPPSLSAPLDRDFRIVGGALNREEVRYDDERRA